MRKFNKNVVKRIAAGAFSAAMLMGALTGCGVSTSSKSSDVTAEQTEQQTTAATTVAPADPDDGCLGDDFILN